jgi:phosphoglycolate phosphatase-like HAD superfamily hydrolase
LTRLLLFDIDGTLLLSGGAGKRALNRTFEEMFGVAEAFTGIPVAGRTDPLILGDALERAGVTADPAARTQFLARYCEHFAREIRFPGPRKGLMPGVRPLLDRLRRTPGVACALVTGNIARASRIKLEHFELDRYFVCGAYGDDAPRRDDLVPIAVDRARRAGIDVDTPRQAVVIGDTPLDAQCAAAAGARAVCVATGPFGQDELRRAGADAVFPDLTDAEGFLAAVG